MAFSKIFLAFFAGIFFSIILEYIQASVLSPQNETLTPKLSMNIYYETLCPDSRRFITSTFYPQYHLFKEYLDVNFIPFGKGSINADGSDHQCQHGPDECTNNLIHGCVLYALPPGDEQVEFVNCGMLYPSIDGQKKCVEDRGLNWDDVQKCSKGEQGVKLAILAQHNTFYGTNGGPAFVPTIVFNNTFSDEDQNTSFINPSAVICRYLPSIAPCLS